MRKIWVIFAVALLLTPIAGAQITRTATFENFTAGQIFQSSFTDPLSGITFLDPTSLLVSDFNIDEYSDGEYFNGGNYLTGGGGPFNGLGANFGFTADLPAPADHVSLEAVFSGAPITNIVLTGFDSSGDIVAQEAGQANMSNPFTLEIDSAAYNISTFQVSALGGAAGYDNISFTFLPEPSGLSLVGMAVVILCKRRQIKGLRRVHWL